MSNPASPLDDCWQLFRETTLKLQKTGYQIGELARQSKAADRKV